VLRAADVDFAFEGLPTLITSFSMSTPPSPESFADASTRGSQLPLCLVPIHSEPCHHNRCLYDSARGVQKFAGVIISNLGGLADDSRGAIHQLMIPGLNIHHQIAIDVT